MHTARQHSFYPVCIITLKFQKRLVNAHLMLSLSLLCHHHRSSAVFHAPIVKRRQCNANATTKGKQGNMLAEMPSKKPNADPNASLTRGRHQKVFHSSIIIHLLSLSMLCNAMLDEICNNMKTRVQPLGQG
jgi:hypothetical protein